MHKLLIRILFGRLVPGEERVQVRQNPECSVIACGNVGFHYSRPAFTAVLRRVLLTSTLLSIPPPHRGIVLLMEVEGLRPPAA